MFKFFGIIVVYSNYKERFSFVVLRKFSRIDFQKIGEIWKELDQMKRMRPTGIFIDLTLREFSSRSNLESNIVENWRNLWPTLQGFATTDSETPFHLRKRSRYRLFYSNRRFELN
jgi:hypothetical protein